MSRFVPADRNTAYLLPPSVDEWLPMTIWRALSSEVIEQLDLSDLVRQYAAGARRRTTQPCSWDCSFTATPTACTQPPRSGDATYDSVAFRYVAANTTVTRYSGHIPASLPEGRGAVRAGAGHRRAR